MEELQVMQLENTEIASWDFEKIKGQIQDRLDVYKNIVYTDDNIKSAKEDRSTLNKAKKVIEDYRKEYKAKCMAPYETLEPKIKELVEMIEKQRMLIDDRVKDFEKKQKEEKELEVKKYYNRKAFVLGTLAEPLYNKLLDAKWLNASTSKVKYEEEVQLAINSALNDINIIKNMNSPYVDTLLEKYIETLSMEVVKAKLDELEIAACKAGMTQQEKSQVVISNEEKTEIKANETEGVNVKIYANTTQMRQICDFMKAIGVNYEM